jgi:hypothetical protein
MERPALQRLLADIRERVIDVILVYKVDRLTRSFSTTALRTCSCELTGAWVWPTPLSALKNRPFRGFMRAKLSICRTGLFPRIELVCVIGAANRPPEGGPHMGLEIHPITMSHTERRS